MCYVRHSKLGKMVCPKRWWWGTLGSSIYHWNFGIWSTLVGRAWHSPYFNCEKPTARGPQPSRAAGWFLSRNQRSVVLVSRSQQEGKETPLTFQCTQLFPRGWWGSVLLLWGHFSLQRSWECGEEQSSFLQLFCTAKLPPPLWDVPSPFPGVSHLGGQEPPLAAGSALVLVAVWGWICSSCRCYRYETQPIHIDKNQLKRRMSLKTSSSWKPRT